MQLSITLAPDGGLRVILPQGGRTLDLGNDVSALRFLQRILRCDEREQRRGYIKEFPTQHVIEIWRKEDLARKSAEYLAEQKEKAEERRAELAAKGIDIDALDISL